MPRSKPRTRPPSCRFAFDAAAPQAIGLAAWFPAAGQPGGTLRDESGHGLDLAAETHDATLALDAEFGPVARATTAGDGGKWSRNSGPDLGGYPFTMTLWFRSYDAGSAALFCLGHLGTGHYSLVAAPSSNLVRVTHTGGTELSVTAAGGRWHHLALVCLAGDSRRLYVNGRLGATSTLPVAFPATTRLTLGGDTLGNCVNALFSDARVYRGALHAAEVWSLFADPWRLHLPIRRRRRRPPESPPAPGGNASISSVPIGSASLAQSGESATSTFLSRRGALGARAGARFPQE